MKALRILIAAGWRENLATFAVTIGGFAAILAIGVIFE